MSKFQKMLATADKEIKMPKTESPKEKETSVTKTLNDLTLEEKRAVGLGTIAKKMREQMGQKGLSDADKFGLENMARTKAPQLSGDLIDLVIESDILSADLAKDIFATTTVGQVLGIEEVGDLADAVTIDNDDMIIKVVGEGNDIPDTEKTLSKMKHFVYDMGGTARFSYLAQQRSIIDLASNKFMSLQSAMGRAVESFIINGDNTNPHQDANFEAGDADIPEKFGKGLRKIARTKETVDFGGSALSDIDLIKFVDEMITAGGVYTDYNAITRGDVTLFVTQGLYLRMSRMEQFTDASKSGNASTLAGGINVATFRGMPLVVASYAPAKTNASGVVDAVGANNVFESAILVNTKFFKPYYYGDAIVETDRNIVNKTNILTLSQKFGFSGLYDSATEAYNVDTNRKYAIYGINIAL